MAASADGLQPRCKECTKHYRKTTADRDREKNKAYQDQWRAKNPDKYKNGLRDWNLRTKFGINLTEYAAMLAAQDNKCKICGTDKCSSGRSFAVDHCHATGKVRGLLCHECNRALGMFKDDPALLKAAIQYLADSQT